MPTHFVDFGEPRLLSFNDIALLLLGEGARPEALPELWKDLRRHHALPADSGRLNAIGNSIGDCLKGRGLFFTWEIDVWPSSDNRYAFEAIRNTKYSTGAVSEFPGEIVDFGTGYSNALLITSMRNFYDICLISEADRSTIFISHDSWIAYELKGNHGTEENLQMLHNLLAQ